VRLAPGERYRVIGRNKSDATHYQLRIEGIQPPDRWVAVDCGRLEDGLAAGPSEPAPEAYPVPPVRATYRATSMEGQYVLAASWQPAFCERRYRTPECRTQSPERTDARRFSLHGLWPQPIGNVYCGVSGRERDQSESGDWKSLTPLDLGAAAHEALAQRMPGSLSYLDRHQWIKHGTCYGTDVDTYFSHAMVLLDQLNGSAVQGLFESNLGQRLRASQVRQAFDRDFGAGAGERVRLVCDDQGLITELRIGLKGTIGPDPALGELIRAAPTRSVGCRGGWVDQAGRGR
jgi:ribonuclease T2